MTAKLLRISGQVQGVGFRAWMVRRAVQLGVNGWVRNRGDGTVEALLFGDPAAVEELLRNCRRGPPGATVALIHEDLAEPDPEPGFRAAPTVP